MFAKDNLLPWRTAARNVELALESGAQSRRRRRSRARELLTLVGLEGFEDAYPRELSHGMRQRAALARTLAPDPDVLLMDEPLAALDAHTKLRMQNELLRILDQAGGAQRKTVVFVTHDLQEALLLGDRVVVMLPRPGRIAQDRLSGLPRDRAGQLGETMFTDRFRALHEELFHLLEARS
jgi:NitT/TauT family transport system ATP-binding protein